MLARHVPAHTQHATPDPIRITAGSAALLINAVVALLLLQPRQWSEPTLPARPEHRTVVKLIPRTVVPAPMPPTPAKPAPVPHPTTTPRLVTAPPQPAPVDTPMAIPVAPVAALEPMSSAPDTSASPSDTTQAGIDYAFAPPPPYPPVALRRGIEGTVWLRIEVDESGTPVKVTVAHSSGDHTLDSSARSHVLNRWRFQPARVEGQAVAGVALVPVAFAIERR